MIFWPTVEKTYNQHVQPRLDTLVDKFDKDKDNKDDKDDIDGKGDIDDNDKDDNG